MDDAIKVLRYALTRDGSHSDAMEALAAIERLVQAAKALLVVRAGPTPDDVAPYYRAVTELNDALAAVLGEGSE